MSNESQPQQPSEPRRPPELHPNSETVEYDTLVFKVRKDDRHALINSYLGMLLQNIEKASKNFVIKANHYINLKEGELARDNIDQYVFFLKEAQEHFEELSEIIDETLVLDSSVVAKITAQMGVPYDSGDLNQLVKQSGKDLQEEKKEIKKRKESRVKAASKKKDAKKASKK